MKRTLLDLTQDILNSMSSDEVNSISDTTESEQVANILKTVYFDIVSEKNLSEHHELFQLTGLADATKPNYLQIPDNVLRMDLFKYNVVESGGVSPDYEDITYVDNATFLSKQNMLNSSDSNVDEITDYGGATYLIINDAAPSYYTCFDNEHVVTNSYDSAVDSTLQQSQTQCYGLVAPTWTHSDTFVPDLDARLFPYFLEEARSTCFIWLKQQADPKTEKRVRRKKTRLARDKWRDRNERYSSYGPDYGR